MPWAVDVAVSPNATGPGGTHPTLVLYSDGRIVASNGAGVPENGTSTHFVPTGVSSWNVPRFNALFTPTVGRPEGGIAKKIIVTDWSDPASPSGHVLDGWGRIHNFGTALQIFGGPSWGPGILDPPGTFGTDVARDFAIDPAIPTNGYLLDYVGAVHTLGGSPPMIVMPSFNAADLARGLSINFGGAFSPHGWVLDAWGGMHRVATNNTSDPWVSTGTFGGAYHPSWDIMRDLVYNYSTDVGYVMDGWGGVFPFGADPALGPQGQGQGVGGAPYTAGHDGWIALAWPDPSLQFFVSLNRSGAAHPWNQFVTPTWTFTFPITVTTTTSRPPISGTYGPSGALKPGALTTIISYLYPRSVRLAPGFVPWQAHGAIWSFGLSGIIGTEPGDTFTFPEMSQFVIDGVVYEDLPNNASNAGASGPIGYDLFVIVTSTEGLTSAWHHLGFTTNYAGMGAPGLSATPQPDAGTPSDNITGLRVELVASGGGGSGPFYEFQFSDDSLTWYTVLAGQEVPVGTPKVYDYELGAGLTRHYRVFRKKVTPFLRTNPSAVLTRTMPVPARGVDWRFIKLDGTKVVVVKAMSWSQTFRQQLEIHDPASSSYGEVQSGGARGIEGTLVAWTLDRQAYDDLSEFVKDPQVYLLQTNMQEQWYVWLGESSAEFIRAAPVTSGPDAVYPLRHAYQWTIKVYQTTRPGLV